jgi:ABC-2 type transport system ATP-binding protein
MSAIFAENITKKYASHTALENVSLEVPEGSIYGLLGPNGAGKTSFIRIINQITAPDAGSIRLFNKPLNADSVELIGYLPEERGLYKKMKVGEQALYLARLKGLSKSEAKKKLQEWFERLEIDGWWNKKVEELSKGMAQKIQFVTTVLHEPKLLILDEPFSGFDPINIEIIKNEILRLRDEGATVILSSHNMASVEQICDHMALIHKSHKVLDGKVQAVREQFRNNTYYLEFTGNQIAFANALWTNFKLIDSATDSDKITRCTVQIPEDSSLNALLNAILPEVQIRQVHEVIPSVHDIFIQAVSEKETENPLEA